MSHVVYPCVALLIFRCQVNTGELNHCNAGVNTRIGDGESVLTTGKVTALMTATKHLGAARGYLSAARRALDRYRW